MTKPTKIITRFAVVLGGLALMLVIAAVIVLRTDWFREYVREKIISAVEDSTGGRVELKTFTFDRRGLTAKVDGFVIHGTEPPGSAPLFEARSIVLRLKLLTGLKKAIDLEYLGADQPSANIIVFANGQTNIPTPKAARQTSGKPGLATVIDLAIHQVEISGGRVQFLQKRYPFSARGQNLRADLLFDPGTARYQGEISMSPILAASEGRRPLPAKIAIPISLEHDKIQITNARIETAASNLVASAVVEHLASPEVSGNVGAHLALNELTQSMDLPFHPKPNSGPQALDAAIAVRSDHDVIQIRNAQFALGRSHLEASGDANITTGNTAANFRGTLSPEEIAQLLALRRSVSGIVQVSGKLNLEGSVDSGTIAANFEVRALGGELTADTRVEKLSDFTMKAGLRGFQIQTVAAAFGLKPPGYGGSISGNVEAQGNLKASSVSAGARLAIAPGGSGTPISGRINAGFKSSGNIISLDNSQIGLPNTRIDFSGDIGKQAQIRVVSRNLDDFLPAFVLFSSEKPPVALRGGAVTVTADVRGRLDAPDISGQAAATNFSIGQRRFDRFAAGFHASPSGASVDNGTLARNGALAQFSASIGLRDWTTGPEAPLTANAAVRDGDLADLLALAGRSDIRASGLLNADAKISGTVGNPQGSAQVTVVNGAAYDEPFDRLQMSADLSDQLLNIKSAKVAAGAARVEMQGSFAHPRDSFETGRIQVHLASTQIQLSQFKTLQKRRPGLTGILNFNADASGELRNNQSQNDQAKLEFVPASVIADLNAKDIRDRGQSYGNLTATVRTDGGAMNARVDSDFAGSNIQLTSRTQLAANHVTSGDATIQGLPIERALAIANMANQVPAAGTLSGSAHFAGTLDDPHANVTLNLTKAVLYGEPLDRLEAAINYTNDQVSLTSVKLASPAGQAELNGSFSHAASDFHNGRVNLHLATAGIDLRRVQQIQKKKSGLAGKLRLTADISTDLRSQNGEQQVLPVRFDVTGGASGVEWDGRKLGNATFEGQTKDNVISLKMGSDFANSEIHGTGQVRLQGEYPLDAKLSFANVTYSGWSSLLGPQPEMRPGFDAVVDGEVTVSGPIKRATSLQGDLQLSKIELSATVNKGAGKKNVTIQNQGPIKAHLDSSAVRIQQARLAGPSTDITLEGTVPLDKHTPIGVTVNGQADLAIVKDFSPDMYSSGRVMLNSTVRGTLAQPLLNGRIQLQNASLESADWPNGISKANGEILLNGTNLAIRTLTAESGGGRISLGGFVGFTGTALTYDVRAEASRVRSRYAGVSLVTNAAVTLSGTSERSVLGGNVTIERIGYNQQNDIASILAGSSTPPSEPVEATGPIAGMRLNLRIQTAPDVRFQTTLAEGLAGTADLTLRGTLLSPGMTGRISVTKGALLFFGNKYTINRGSVSFYEGARIEPILDVDLETSVSSVDVVLTVSGPIENLKLAYRSDPPLKFEDIVALLATGRTPPDATIAAHQPAPPDQSIGQMGESAVLSQAIADPLASRLQRVFGVSQLKIDPTFNSGSPLPQARVTLQQQVSGNITFTYTQDLTQTNSQIIRVEWGFTPRFSAVATRDENGIFGVDFLYKKQFR